MLELETSQGSLHMDVHGKASRENQMKENQLRPTLVNVEKHNRIVLDELDLPYLALLQANSGDRECLS